MITQKELKELLHYQPDAGVFIWLVNRGKAKAGVVAGSDHMYHRWGRSIASGYKAIRINQKTYFGTQTGLVIHDWGMA